MVTGKYGMFGSAEERDAWVAERDLLIAAEAHTLANVGITSPEDLVTKYSALCDLFERFYHWTAGGDAPDLDTDPDDVLMTSDEARIFADRVLAIMHGGPWRAS